MWKIRYIDEASGELTEAHHEGTLAQAIEKFGEERIVVAQRVAPAPSGVAEAGQGSEAVSVAKG